MERISFTYIKKSKTRSFSKLLVETAMSYFLPEVKHKTFFINTQLNRENYHTYINNFVVKLKGDFHINCKIGVNKYSLIIIKHGNTIEYTHDDCSEQYRKFTKTSEGIKESSFVNSKTWFHEFEGGAGRDHNEHTARERYTCNSSDIWWKKCNVSDTYTMFRRSNINLLTSNCIDERPNGINVEKRFDRRPDK